MMYSTSKEVRMQRDVYKDEELARRVSASIVGTNGTIVRSRCDTPKDFYNWWYDKQIVLERADYIEYADQYEDELMVLIEKLYKNPQTLKTKYLPTTHYSEDGYIRVQEHRTDGVLNYITIRNKHTDQVHINVNTLPSVLSILKRLDK